MAILTIAEAAKALGVTRIYIGRLLKWKKLRGVQLENEWLVESRSVGEYQKTQRRPEDDTEEGTPCPILGLSCPLKIP